MRELKIGDRVVVLKKQLDTIPAGAVGTVVSFDNPVLVDFGRNGEECIIRTDEPYKVRCGLCTHFGISLHDIGFIAHTANPIRAEKISGGAMCI